jgi:hypothetical protein
MNRQTGKIIGIATGFLLVTLAVTIVVRAQQQTHQPVPLENSQAAPQSAMPSAMSMPQEQSTEDPDGEEADAMKAMADLKMPMNAHMKMTELRPANDADRRRADSIVRELRGVLEKYRNYEAAEKDGYQPFLANLDLPQYHFTNYRYGLIGALWFRPSKPTSLLYRKTPKGYELLGAMYTASRFASEEQLDRRVPLSVARWHAHVNICLPPKSQYPTADWKRFGFAGSIVTEQSCTEAGGTFYPQLFGWMVHVYPFEKSPDKIWAR